MKRKAKTQAERSAASASKRQRLGEVELRHRVRPGVLEKLADLTKWGEFEQLTELIQTMILNVHALGPGGAQQFLKVPRHKCDPTENVARDFYDEGAKIAARLDRSEE
ncbi:hypothetical protein ACLUTX_12470 [Enterobacterales bacterium AE_CKDN230030158-1A_HGKHYDSX7]